MAWYDDLLNKTKEFVPDDINIFGAAPPKFSTKAQALGLLGPDAIKNANKQSVFQGLLSTGLAYAAQPKNQNYGSILPYLAKAYGTGMQAAQNPYTQLGKDMQYKQQFDEYEKKKRIEDLSSKLFTTTNATTQPGVYKANADLAPIDAANPLGLNIAPNFNIPKEVTIPGKRTLNEGNLKELMGLDITKGAAALTIDDKFVARDQLDASKLAIKEFTTKYPEYKYLNKQEPSIAMGTIRSLVGPSSKKIIGDRYVYDILNKSLMELQGIPDDIGKQKGMYQQGGFAVDPDTGVQLPITFDSGMGTLTVIKDGVKIPFSELLFNGKKPLLRGRGDLNRTQLDGNKMVELTNELTKKETSLTNISNFVVRNSELRNGIPKYLDMIKTDLNTLFSLNKGLTPQQLMIALQTSEFQKLVGANRLSVVGSGTMTEFDAQRVMLAIGGDPAAITTNTQVVERQISTLMRDSYNEYKNLKENYDTQLRVGNQIFGKRKDFVFNKETQSAMSPHIILDLGLQEFNKLNNPHIAKLFIYQRDRFDKEMENPDLSDEDRARIAKFVDL